MSEPTVPGYEERKRIREVLPGLSRRARTAFAAGCAERVLPLVEDYFGRELGECRKAIELAWRYALGESVADSEIEETVDACEALADELYEDDEVGFTLYALNAVSYALQSATKVESELAEDAASNAAGAAHVGDMEHGDEYIQEESDWQMLALDAARASAKPTRDMFKHLPSNPKWLRAALPNRR